MLVGHWVNLLYGWVGKVQQAGITTPSGVKTNLLAYGRSLNVKGQCSVNVKLGDQLCKNMMLIILNENGSNLLGLDWSDTFELTSRVCPY